MVLTRTAAPIVLTSRAKRSVTAPVSFTASASSNSDSGCDEYHNYVMAQSIANHLVSRTEKKIQAFLDQSQWVRNNSCLSQLPCFGSEDLVIGRVVAEGGFSHIHEIKSFNIEAGLLETDPATCTPITEQQRYVVKHLKPELALNPRRLRSAARDICNEMHVLSALNHRHIVQISGLSSEGVAGFASTGRADGFFLVLPRLEQSLIQRISEWRRGLKYMGSLSLEKIGKCEATRKLFQERVLTARQLASALTYLHERRILHRDIKPDNVGFDAEGCLKLIDFGLAIEMPESDDPNASFDLGNAGTVRYQAPEVIVKLPYNQKSETFSFTIVLWEIISLTKPHKWLNCDEVKESVPHFGLRPPLQRSWPKALRSLLKKGWSKRTSDRPSMAEMEVKLELIANDDYSKKSSAWALFGL